MSVGNAVAAQAFTTLPPMVMGPARAEPVIGRRFAPTRWLGWDNIGNDDIRNNRALRPTRSPCDSLHLISCCLGCRMNLRMRENPWRLMLAVNAAVLIGVFLYKITREPYVPYIHLLVDYHFGFTKRALIGAVVSLFFPKVPVWLVFALSGAVWLVTLGLFIKLFRRTFGFDDAHMPLFVFMAGSPFFLKNFMHTLGHFDIYGCAFAICLLLVPARSIVFVLLAALASMILILIHHIHLLMYVPTIAVIVVLRYYLMQGFSRQNAITGIVAISCIGLLFFAAQFRGSLAVPEPEFVQYLQAAWPTPTRTNLLSFSYIWYQPLAQEIHDTWDRMPSNL